MKSNGSLQYPTEELDSSLKSVSLSSSKSTFKVCWKILCIILELFVLYILLLDLSKVFMSVETSMA